MAINHFVDLINYMFGDMKRYIKKVTNIPKNIVKFTIFMIISLEYNLYINL